MTEWQEGECSAECAGGIRQLTRTVVTMPQGGSECPPLVTDAGLVALGQQRRSSRQEWLESFAMEGRKIALMLIPLLGDDWLSGWGLASTGGDGDLQHAVVPHRLRYGRLERVTSG